MPTHAQQIVQLLRTNPAGLTTREVADRLHMARSTAGGVLSKLAAYDHGVEKVGRAHVQCNAYIWRAKPNA
jgi:hypothetical protein